MKVLQAPFCFYPDPVGGTEVYVAALGRCLRDRGIETVVVAPAQQEKRYVHEGQPVRRLPIRMVVPDLRALYGRGDEETGRAFGKILDEERPHIVHLHAFCRGLDLRALEQAKKRNIPFLFTLHTPDLICQRGTLMRWGKEACDGKLRRGLCARCTLQKLGLPRPVADAVGCTPISIGETLEKSGLSGSLWTALRMRQLTSIRHSAARAFLAGADRLVAVSDWGREVLIRNGVPPGKVMVSRHGLILKPERTPEIEGETSRAAAPRVIFLGRMDPTKGPHVLIEALRRAPALELTLDLYGIVQNAFDAAYLERLKKRSQGDRRVVFHLSVRSDEVISLLKEYDLLAVPSQWLETGPMVVLEAFAAGIPVLGSRLGGLCELVQEGVNGMLVEPGSPGAWAGALEKLCADQNQLAKLRQGIRPPRSMTAVADEMKTLYEEVLS